MEEERTVQDERSGMSSNRTSYAELAKNFGIQNQVGIIEYSSVSNEMDQYAQIIPLKPSVDRSDCYPVSDTVLSPIGERRESELRTMEQLMKIDSLARTESQKSDAEGPRLREVL